MTARQPRGVPTGGQFAPSAHDDASVDLSSGRVGDYSHEEVVSAIRDALTEHMGRIHEHAEDYLDEIGVNRMVSSGNYYEQPEYADVELTFDEGSVRHFTRVAEDVASQEPELVRVYPGVKEFADDIVDVTMGNASELPREHAQKLYEIVGTEENRRDEFTFQVVEHRRYNIVVGASVEE